MIRLRHSKHNVSRRCLKRYYSARTPPVDRYNAFIASSPNPPYKPPNPQSLIDAGLERLLERPAAFRNTLAVKDNISTEDFPTTCASHALEGYRSPVEATVVSLLRHRGMRVNGKTNMDEFGMGSHSTHTRYGAVVQRYAGPDGAEVEYSAGGSSGGSAVAVRNRLCNMALGTDTGGSVRLPAAWCGVVGFKPSYGLVSRWGVVDYANSFDTVGFLGRSVHAVKKMWRSTAFPDIQDPTSIPLSTTERVRGANANVEHRPWKIGVPVEYNIAELSPTVRDAWAAAIEGCQKMGHEVVPISLPSTKSALSAYYVLAPAEASSNLAKYDGVRFGSRADGPDGLNGILYSKTRDQGFGSEVKRRILLGSYSLSADAINNYFIQAQKVRRLVQTDFNNVFRTPHPLLPQSHTSQFAQDYDWASGPGLDAADPDISDASGKSNVEDEGRVDFILCPTAPTPPPKLKGIENQTPVESYINDVFTVPASMAGLPAISIPWGNAENEDPSKNVGLQLIGQFGQDSQVLGFALRLQNMQRGSGDQEVDEHE